MKIEFRYLSEDEIENEAALLISEYVETTGAPMKLVPVGD